MKPLKERNWIAKLSAAGVRGDLRQDNDESLGKARPAAPAAGLLAASPAWQFGSPGYHP
jgi:hypothetical protein